MAQGNTLESILLLMNNDRNRQLLNNYLGSCYRVSLMDKMEYLDAALDLCIVDGPSLKQFRDILKARKTSEKGLFLPVLLVTTKKDIGMMTAGLWRIVDEVICSPIQKAELHARVEALLRAQRLSKELLQYKEEELEQSRRSLLETKELYRAMVACTPLAMFSMDLECKVLTWNKASEALFGWQAQETIGKPLPIVPPEKQAEWKSVVQRIVAGESVYGMETAKQLKNGSLIECNFYGAPIRDQAGNIVGIMAAVEDISQRKAAEKKQRSLEEQLQKTQKLEALGRLAGGVAHDFNNNLSVIIGHTEIALESLLPEDPLQEPLREIHSAAERSRDIARQLLAFARKEVTAPEPMDLNTAIGNSLKFLCRLIGEDIELIWKPGKITSSILMDPSQLDQVLANLCINAKDAIADVGKITIETDMAAFEEQYCIHHPGVLPGEFVMLCVSDTGCGMDREILDRIFEPFFTTKEPGKGTGLGLATVYGIVKQNNGFINVYSEPGHGTTFKVYFPRQPGDIASKATKTHSKAPMGKGEKVLVVEDDKTILALVDRILTGLNYQVIATQKPSEALQFAKSSRGDIALLISDVVMPQMNGRDLAQKILSLSPETKCLFMSGYTPDVVANKGILEKGCLFIQKPFSFKDLAAKVRAALDQK